MHWCYIRLYSRSCIFTCVIQLSIFLAFWFFISFLSWFIWDFQCLWFFRSSFISFQDTAVLYEILLVLDFLLTFEYFFFAAQHDPGRSGKRRKAGRPRQQIGSSKWIVEIVLQDSEEDQLLLQLLECVFLGIGAKTQYDTVSINVVPYIMCLHCSTFPCCCFKSEVEWFPQLVLLVNICTWNLGSEGKGPWTPGSHFIGILANPLIFDVFFSGSPCEINMYFSNEA